MDEGFLGSLNDAQSHQTMMARLCWCWCWLAWNTQREFGCERMMLGKISFFLLFAGLTGRTKERSEMYTLRCETVQTNKSRSKLAKGKGQRLLLLFPPHFSSFLWMMLKVTTQRSVGCVGSRSEECIHSRARDIESADTRCSIIILSSSFSSGSSSPSSPAQNKVQTSWIGAQDVRKMRMFKGDVIDECWAQPPLLSYLCCCFRCVLPSLLPFFLLVLFVSLLQFSLLSPRVLRQFPFNSPLSLSPLYYVDSINFDHQHQLHFLFIFLLSLPFSPSFALSLRPHLFPYTLSILPSSSLFLHIAWTHRLRSSASWLFLCLCSLLLDWFTFLFFVPFSLSCSSLSSILTSLDTLPFNSPQSLSLSSTLCGLNFDHQHLDSSSSSSSSSSAFSSSSPSPYLQHSSLSSPLDLGELYERLMRMFASKANANASKTKREGAGKEERQRACLFIQRCGTKRNEVRTDWMNEGRGWMIFCFSFLLILILLLFLCVLLPFHTPLPSSLPSLLFFSFVLVVLTYSSSASCLLRRSRSAPFDLPACSPGTQ